MKRDVVIIIAIIIGLGVAALVLLRGSGRGGELDARRGSPFDRPTEVDEREAGRIPAREVRDPGPAAVSVGVEEAGPARELPPVTSRDDFGALQGGLLVLVQGPDGLALPGAEVALHVHFGGTGLGALRGELLAEKASDEAGEASFDGLDVDRDYALLVRHPDHRRFRAAPLGLRPGEFLVQVAAMGQGLSLGGRVAAKEGGGTIAGARVVVWDLVTGGADPEGEIEASVETDAEGRFLLENLAAGPKRLMAEAEGFGSSSRPWSLLPGSAPAEVEFLLGGGAAISGQVLEPDGRPIAGAEVRARPVVGQNTEVVTAFYPSTLTDAVGRFRIDGLLEGQYFLRAAKEGYAEGNFGRPGEPRKASMANAIAGEVGVELYLGVGPVVKGRVIDGETGEPLQVFDLYSDGNKDPVELDPRLRRRIRDPLGRFDHAVPVLGSQARYVWLHARAPGYSGGRALVDFASRPGSAGPLLKLRDAVEIVMLRGGALGGRVTDPRGRPLEGCRVIARRLRDPETVPNSTLQRFRSAETYLVVGKALSDAEGRFRVQNLGAGRYRLDYEHPDFAPATHRDEIVFSGEGEDEVGTTSLASGGTVVGQVVDDDGRPEEGARVELMPLDRRLGLNFSMRTGLGGAFRFDRVPPGEYRLVVTERDGLDTRSAWYQELKQRRPAETPVLVTDGSEESFRLDR